MEHNLFLPMIMESSRGSSAIIIKISRSSIYLTRRSAARRLHFHHSFHENPSLEEGSDNIMEIGHSSISLTRRSAACQLYSHFNGEPNRKLCHHHGDQLFVEFFFKDVSEPPLSYPRSWRIQEGALSSSWKSAVRRFFFTRCDRNPAFLPKIMESPRGSSAIIMEIDCYSILLFPYPWRVQEGPLPSSWNFAGEPI